MCLFSVQCQRIRCHKYVGLCIEVCIHVYLMSCSHIVAVKMSYVSYALLDILLGAITIILS